MTCERVYLHIDQRALHLDLLLLVTESCVGLSAMESGCERRCVASLDAAVGVNRTKSVELVTIFRLRNLESFAHGLRCWFNTLPFVIL